MFCNTWRPGKKKGGSQALNGEDITVFGEGSQTRSFCYVADQVEGLMALMEYEGAQPGPVGVDGPWPPSWFGAIDRDDLPADLARNHDKYLAESGFGAFR